MASQAYKLEDLLFEVDEEGLATLSENDWLRINSGLLTEEELNELQDNVAETVNDALEFARESPYPNEEDLLEDMYADPLPA